ncbi:MAG: FTR1 family protein [Actinomycetales bacterium]|nr:FTR1 family protein [Actinomycetales bacterium]
MLANYLIGLREGLEAALVVSILLTYLVRTQREHLIKFVTYGVASAVGFSVLVGSVLQVTENSLNVDVEPIFAGLVSFVAVGFVTWMIFWMKKSARTISGELRNRLDAAAVAGGGVAIAAMAFVAVAREGAETAIFFWAAAHASGNELVSLAGLILGLGTAIALGVAFYRSTVKLNLTSFFKVTGVMLAIVAAGVLSYGIHEFQEIGWLPGEDNVVLNLERWLPAGSAIATLMAGLFNLSAKTSGLQAVAWVAYLAVVLTIFLRKPVPPTDPTPTAQESAKSLAA